MFRANCCRDLFVCRIRAGSHCPHNSTPDVPSKIFFKKRFFRMTHTRVPGAAAFKLMHPRNWMVSVHCDFPQILIVHSHQHTNIFARVGAKPVPLVLASPQVWKFDRADVCCVLATNGGQNNLGVIFKHAPTSCPYQGQSNSVSDAA